MMNPMMMMSNQTAAPQQDHVSKFNSDLVLKRKFQSHLVSVNNNININVTWHNNLNQINVVQSMHSSKEQRICSAFKMMDQLLLDGTYSSNYLFQHDIDGLFCLAKNIILYYYLCKLENPNFTMKVIKHSDNSIFVTKIGHTDCLIALTGMQSR